MLDALRSGQVICGGRVSREAAVLAEERGLVLRDYFLREELAVANAGTCRMGYFAAPGCFLKASGHMLSREGKEGETMEERTSIDPELKRLVRRGIIRHLHKKASSPGQSGEIAGEVRQ